MTLDLKTALSRMRTDPTDAENWLVLETTIETLKRGGSVVQQHADDAARDVLLKAVERARRDGFEDVDTPKAYLRRMLVNRSIDLHRKVSREQHRDDLDQCAEERRPPPQVPRDWELLNEVFRVARFRREARYRPVLQQSWDEIVARASSGRSTLEVLSDAGKPHDAAALNRAYTAHRRCRRALQEAADWMLSTDKLDPEAHDRATFEVKRLLRCQVDPDGTSPRHEGVSHG